MSPFHEGMDDTADWAQTHWGVCTGNCNQGRACVCQPPKPAEACTELGSEYEGDPLPPRETRVLLLVCVFALAVLCSLGWVAAHV